MGMVKKYLGGDNGYFLAEYQKRNIYHHLLGC